MRTQNEVQKYRKYRMGGLKKVCIFAARKIKTEYFCNHHIIINKQTLL